MNEKLTITSIEPLIENFQKTFALSDMEKDLLMEKFRMRLYRKRQYVLQEGDVCTQFNFVVRGCLRMSSVDDKGNLHVLQFATENNWINDLGSFHGVKPSKLNIDALEDSVVLQISRDELIDLYMQAPKFDRIFRVLIENGFINLQERLLQYISSSAEERYETFLVRFPYLVNRIWQVQIAAFLGVTPEFLSRLRKQRIREGRNS